MPSSSRRRLCLSLASGACRYNGVGLRDQATQGKGYEPSKHLAILGLAVFNLGVHPRWELPPLVLTTRTTNERSPITTSVGATTLPAVRDFWAVKVDGQDPLIEDIDWLGIVACAGLLGGRRCSVRIKKNGVGRRCFIADGSYIEAVRGGALAPVYNERYCSYHHLAGGLAANDGDLLGHRQWPATGDGPAMVSGGCYQLRLNRPCGHLDGVEERPCGSR
ncbi:unnamed protein product [Lactuca virosa]|uniref:Uncharacterized protein n=1 Tax=Lactuca virosa TaxID=75947 RepID=A0AAU9MSL8_9ASTR|nr:unnamed protein product [Lactuca virosa]